MCLDISQNSQKNNCARVPFLIKLQALGLKLYIKKENLAQVFSCESCKISKNTFFTEHLWVSDSNFWMSKWSGYCPQTFLSLRLGITELKTFLAICYTAKNTVISPNFLVWKFCGKAQFPHSFGRNCVFQQNLNTWKLGEITLFYGVYGVLEWLFRTITVVFNSRKSVKLVE